MTHPLLYVDLGTGGAGDSRAADSGAADSGPRIEEIIADLAAKQQRLSAYLDDLLDSDQATPAEVARLLALHAQTASRLGRLLRDRRALSGEAADGIAGAIAQALDELSSELGVEL